MGGVMDALKNTWYPAAWSKDVGTQLLKRTLLNESIVFFRTGDGAPVALANMCPHRFAPLHLGKLIDDTLQCGYHGLRFNAAGKCVFNPDGDGITPSAAKVRSYPLHERYGLLWIWMGDPALADSTILPSYPFMESADRYRPVTGYLHVKTSYRFMIDNLMDVAHVLILHHDMLACPGLALTKTKLVREGSGIWANRLATNTTPPVIFDMMWRRTRGDYTSAMDHWAESRWDAPSLVSQNTGVALTGTPREVGLETKNCHFTTPETDKSTHYFWAICRNFDLDNEKFDAEIRTGTEYAFVQQDEPMVEALQEVVGDREFWSMKPALLQGDIGTVEVRRALDRMIEKERAAPDHSRQPAPTFS
jgi:phenylpropionate dioxygenase-like ring-hydroxylating dioxygenase large terminal subunit